MILSEPQRIALAHLLKTPQAALFMGMGLGKTLTCLTAIAELMDSLSCKGALVVAPLRVANLTWPHEVARWYPWMRVANLRTPEGWNDLLNKRAHIYVINYENLQNLRERYLERTADYAFDTIIFDELTRCKNHGSKRINAIRPFLPRLARRWGLTGTPNPNSYLELFAQFRVLDDGARLGRAFTTFRDCYFSGDYMGYNWTLRPGCDKQILERIADITCTLKSSDWLDIPDTITEDVECSLGDASTHYKKLEKELLLQFSTGEVEAPTAAVLVNKLLQMTGGAVYDTERQVQHLHDSKLKALQGLVKKLKEPVLIACNFRHEQDRIASGIHGCVRFDSATTPKAQDELIRKWNTGAIPAMVADPRSIGHGLNLQDGGRVTIWFSPTWSRELYDQFNARTARRGQEKPPLVFHLLCPGTVDDAVMETLRQRGKDQHAALDVLKNLQDIR